MFELLKESVFWMLFIALGAALYHGFLYVVLELHSEAMELHRRFWNLVTRRNPYGAVHLCWILSIAFIVLVILRQQALYGGLGLALAVWGFVKLHEVRESENDPYAKKGGGPSRGAPE